VTIVYVTPMTSLATSFGLAAGNAEAARQVALDQVAEDMRRRAAEFSQDLGVEVNFVHARGDPFTELRRTRRRSAPTQWWVGASAHAGHRLVGSLAVRLVKAARWPVTVVP
jgi:hypothetical protein